MDQIHYFMFDTGPKDIEECDRDELLQVVRYLFREVNKQHEQQACILNSWSMFRNARRA